jgi:GNAT superfamily N-acetyltransferase
MTMSIEIPTGRESLTEFVSFHDQVYGNRSTHWPVAIDLELPILLGDSPFNVGRRMRPFVATDQGAIVARALAVVDERYQRHWKEKLGHVAMFEALPGCRDAVRRLMDDACEWLASEGAIAARAGMGMLDTPFVVDDYDSLPPQVIRHNPPYYHSLLKDAGFETEKGWVDYKIAVTPPLVARWESALEACRRSPIELVALAEVPEPTRIVHFTDTWADTFKSHWGWSAFSQDEMAVLLGLFAPAGALDTSLLAYHDGVPVGFVVVVPEISAFAATKPGRELRDDEKLNFLGIGVRESARGRGVNLAMAARSYLDLAKRGAKYLSYTLVLDDNWPSRRTGEKLGAYVCANYVTYRRNFRR